jgi:rhodanese-related sulfurtransferase
MGPLVPDLITNELNLVVALLVGVGFGFILEQAGFSSSRKLTGLFYGTDFTVLRVFFTAGGTAMASVLLLEKLGFLDASVIYVNPTFLHSAIAGGLIMGVGFVVGGFCPGTSFCGAAVGRIDAMAFVAGGMVGVLGFGEAFPLVRDFYQAGSLGDVTVPSMIGISPGLFTVALIAVAVVAFVATSVIERRVNPAGPVSTFPILRHRLAGAAFFAAALMVAVLPSSHDRLLAAASDESYRRTHPLEHISSDELAFRITDQDPSVLLVDVRPAAVFAKSSLPGAVNVPIDDLFGRSLPGALLEKTEKKVFYGDDEEEGQKAATVARLLGFENVAVLQGGLGEFTRTVLDARVPPQLPDGSDGETLAFRAEAARQITDAIKARANAAPVERKPKKIVGGCGV